MKFRTTQLGPSSDLIFETSVWFYFDLLLFLLFIYLFIFICYRNIYRLPITLVYGCWCKRPMHSLLIYEGDPQPIGPNFFTFLLGLMACNTTFILSLFFFFFFNLFILKSIWEFCAASNPFLFIIIKILTFLEEK